MDACPKKVEEDTKAISHLSLFNKTFETLSFNKIVTVLERMFVHHLCRVGRKDGSPLNEVRLIANSILINNKRLDADNTIRQKKEKRFWDHARRGCPRYERDVCSPLRSAFDETAKKFS